MEGTDDSGDTLTNRRRTRHQRAAQVETERKCDAFPESNKKKHDTYSVKSHMKAEPSGIMSDVPVKTLIRAVSAQEQWSTISVCPPIAGLLEMSASISRQEY